MAVETLEPQVVTCDADFQEETTPVVTFSLKISELLEGHRLNSDLKTEEGILLLASGSIITHRFKEILRKRGVDSVRLDSRDAGAMKLSLETQLDNGLRNLQFADDIAAGRFRSLVCRVG